MLRSPSPRSVETGAPAFVDTITAVLGSSWMVAIGAVLFAWFGSRLLAERLRPRLEERVLRPTTANAVLLTARVAIVLYALIPAATLLGFRPQNVLLSFTVLSLVVGAILAPVGQSYVSGLFIMVNQPYEVGDLIELVDLEERGYVADVTLGYTKIFTLENSFLVVPNETMRERDVRNHSAEDERTRLSIEVSVTYEGDLDRACTLLERAARNVDGVITGGPDIRIGTSVHPARPTAFVREFADHGILIDLRLWTEEPYAPLKLRSDIQRNICNAFESEDVEFAYPHTHHVFDETSGRARVAIDSPERARRGEVAPSERTPSEREHRVELDSRDGDRRRARFDHRPDRSRIDRWVHERPEKGLTD